MVHEDVLLEGVEDHGAWVDAKEVKAVLVGSPDDARDDNLVVMERVEQCGPLKGTYEGQKGTKADRRVSKIPKRIKEDANMKH